MLSCPSRRRRLIARLLSEAITRGAFPVRMSDLSSRYVTSLTQWRRFSPPGRMRPNPAAGRAARGPAAVGRGRQTTTFPCLAAVRGRGHGAGSSAVRVPGSGLRVPARGRGAAFEGGVAGRDARPCRGRRDRCVRRGSGGCGRRPGSGWCWPAASACCGDAAAGGRPGRRGAVTGWAGPAAGRWRPVPCGCLLPSRRRLGAALLSRDSPAGRACVAWRPFACWLAASWPGVSWSPRFTGAFSSSFPWREIVMRKERNLP